MSDDHKTHLSRLREAKQDSAQRKAASPASQPTPFLDISEEEEVALTMRGGDQLWERLLTKVEQEKGEILFASLMGSRRYNLQTSSSDLDFVVVYLPPLDEVIGPGAQPSTIKQLDNFRPDFSLHSLEHYCQLLAEGDAKSIELLFAQKSTVQVLDDSWKALQSMRCKFVSKSMIRNYLGELNGLKGIRKLEKMVASFEEGNLEEKEKINKCAYILLRLVILVERLISGHANGTLDQLSPIWFEDGSEDYLYLHKVRSGAFGAQELIEIVKSRVGRISLDSGLPDGPDAETLHQLDKWRMGLRLAKTPSPRGTQSDPEKANLGISIIPGCLLFLFKNPHDQTYFGVYSVDLHRKLALFGEKTPLVINTRLIQSSDENHLFSVVETGGDPATIYELDRLYDALNRTELTTIMAISSCNNVVWSSPIWEPIYILRSAFMTHTLVYQACGFISGKFKESKGQSDLVRSGKDGFCSKSTQSKIAFALDTLEEAFQPENSSRVSSEVKEEFTALMDQLTEIHDLVKAISSIPAEKSADEEIARLMALGTPYTKKFIALRPNFSSLLLPDIDWSTLRPWFLACRHEAS